MAPRLRGRLNCHYCGKRSTQKQQNGRFKCESCLAVNFLDENGDIADVPAEELQVLDHGSVDLFEANEIFCSTCVKNQRLYTAALSEFLPDPDDPNYDAIDRSVPEHKKKLEERYPQCCSQCEPRVRARLEQATYAARTDHMRRMLEKSRARRISNRWGWRSLVVSFGGVAYFTGLAVQMIWHGLGSQCVGTSGKCVLERPVPQSCVEQMEQYVGWSLAVALLTVWWNPHWQHKLKDEGRLVGLGTYYRLQLVVLAIRFGAWIWLTEHSSRLQPMLHSVSLIVTVVLSAMALWTVGIDTTPLVNWDYEQPALVTKTQYVPPPKEKFSIESLAPAPGVPRQWKPPTPPSEDMMDWAPSHSFDEVKQPRYRNVGRSPFHSTALPAEAKAVGLPPGYFDKRDRLPQKQMMMGRMAEPKFFPPDIDTGLENIFGQVFSLHDSSVRPMTPKTTSSTTPAPEQSRMSTQAPLLSAAFLFLMLTLWVVSDVLVVAIPSLRLYILGFAILISTPALRQISILTFATAIEATALVWIGCHETAPFYDKLGAGIISMLALQQIGTYTLTERADTLPRVVSDLGKKDSSESLHSVDSINTTSTAPAWKTPKRPTRIGMDGLVF